MNTRIRVLAVLMATPIFLPQANVYADAVPDAAALTPAQIEAARTPADHEAIAQALEAEAATLDQKAKSHEAMERIYRTGGVPSSNWVTMSEHCNRLVAQYRLTAKETRELAAAHRATAKALQQ